MGPSISDILDGRSPIEGAFVIGLSIVLFIGYIVLLEFMIRYAVRRTRETFHAIRDIVRDTTKAESD